MKILQIKSMQTVAVPLYYVWAGIRFRPLITAAISDVNHQKKVSKYTASSSIKSGGWLYCHNPIHWRALTKAEETSSEVITCTAINAQYPPYRLCVFIRREKYPLDSIPLPSTPPLRHPLFAHPPQHIEWVQPAHSIILSSPLTLVNCLPFDAHFSIPHTSLPSSAGTINAALPANTGRIPPGDKHILHSVDPSRGVVVKLWTDTLSCPEAGIRLGSTPAIYDLHLTDSQDRRVTVHVKLSRHYGNAYTLTVYAQYWLVNNTGLPLIFRQEGTTQDAATQEEEHEVARCGAPLLFSFTDRELSPYLTLRVGRRRHPGARPLFCQKLPLTPGTTHRRLKVSLMDARPDVVYIVGVDVRAGAGRLRHTLVVTVSPRFTLENR